MKRDDSIDLPAPKIRRKPEEPPDLPAPVGPTSRYEDLLAPVGPKPTIKNEHDKMRDLLKDLEQLRTESDVLVADIEILDGAHEKVVANLRRRQHALANHITKALGKLEEIMEKKR